MYISIFTHMSMYIYTYVQLGMLLFFIIGIVFGILVMLRCFFNRGFSKRAPTWHPLGPAGGMT